MLPHSNLLKKNGGPGEVIYNRCSDKQKDEFDQALIKQVDAHLDYGAPEGVPVEEAVDKERSFPSRALFVNKLANVGGWKASSCWITGGRKDPGAGRYVASSPAAELLACLFLLLLACMFRWPVWCGDIKSAFLQGAPLERDGDLSLKVPTTWPEAVLKHLWKRLGPAFRHDYLKIVKGVFGLGESPRLLS